MTLSVIIPYYNRPYFLENTLWSIYHMTAHAEKFEIVIIDDHSREDLKAEHVVKKFKNKMNFQIHYREEKKGMNGGICRNIGAKKAEGDILLFQDPDPLHMTSIINQIIGKFVYGWDMAIFPACYSLSKEKQLIVDKQDLTKTESILNIRQQVQLLPRSIMGDGEDGWYVHSQIRPVTCSVIFAMRRPTFMEMGGFDEDFYRFWGNEDSDFINRMKLKGMPVLYQDDMLAFHQHHYDPGDLEDVQNRQNGWNYNQQLWLKEKQNRTDWVANRNQEWGVL